MKYSSKMHLSYGLGGFLDNFFTGAFAVRVINFFEKEISLDIAYVSLAFILYGIWNMFNDPLAGYFSDKNYRFTSRWGRRFPWFVISAIPYSIVYLFIFTVPSQEVLASFFWLLAMICLFDLFYSFWMIHLKFPFFSYNWNPSFPSRLRAFTFIKIGVRISPCIDL